MSPLSAHSQIGVIMNLTNSPIMLSQVTDATQTSLFPFPFKFHLVFACIAFIFFAYRFKNEKRPYQLIFAIAIPFSLMIWLSEVKSYFYLIGAIELLFIIAAAVTAIVFKPKKEDKADTPADASSEDENSTEEVSGDDSEE